MNNSATIGLNPKRQVLIGVAALAFVVLNAIAFTQEIYLISVVPAAVLVIYFLFYHTKPFMLFIGFATPFSFNFENLSSFGGIGFYFPTEPLLFGLMLLYILKILSGYRERKELMNHPLTIAILFNLAWIGITSLTSVDIVVSVKFLLSRLWFILVMYFMINSFFSDREYIRKFFYAIIFSMGMVIVYTIVHHSLYAFGEEEGHWVMSPFFKDHTSYGAILAFFFPMVLFHLARAKPMSFGQLLWLGMTGLYTTGIILSYTRAAWVSLVGALGIYLLIKWRINYKLVLVAMATLTGLFFALQVEILHQLEKNRQDSSDSFAEHIQSITNISSDASNLERINRWNSAWKMFLDKPFTGHGPGTYMFEYAKYQKSSDRTIISTNTADAGNAHSEYLGPLSESGVLGMLTILIVVIVSIRTGISLYNKLDHDPYLRGVVICIVLGLVTYFLHGVLNNFLDTDKASVPIWGSMSVLVAISIYHTRYLKRQQSSAVSSK